MLWGKRNWHHLWTKHMAPSNRGNSLSDKVLCCLIAPATGVKKEPTRRAFEGLKRVPDLTLHGAGRRRENRDLGLTYFRSCTANVRWRTLMAKDEYFAALSRCDLSWNNPWILHAFDHIASNSSIWRSSVWVPEEVLNLVWLEYKDAPTNAGVPMCRRRNCYWTPWK